jgi:HSP20 family protein
MRKMTALMPRLVGEVADWFDNDFPVRTLPPYLGHAFRVEDERTDEAYTLRAELPGLDPDADLQVTVDEGLLTIQAERRETEHHRRRTEFRYGMMRRTVRLPANADTEHITATYDKGLLTVTVPLVEPAPTGKTIPVKTI